MFQAGKRLFPLVVSVILYLGVYNVLQPAKVAKMTLSLEFFEFIGLGVKHFFLGYLGGIYFFNQSNVVFLAYGALVLLLLVSVRSRNDVLIWLFIFGIICLNFATLGSADRLGFWSSYLAFNPRYYTDISFIVTILLQILLLPKIQNSNWQKRLSFFGNQYAKLAKGLLSLAILLIIVGKTNLYTTYMSKYFPHHKLNREYVVTLFKDWKQLMQKKNGKIPRFIDLNVSPFVFGEHWLQKPYSIFFQIFTESVDFTKRIENGFVIDYQGHIRFAEFDHFQKKMPLPFFQQLKEKPKVQIDENGCFSSHQSGDIFIEIPLQYGMEFDLAFLKVNYRVLYPYEIHVFYGDDNTPYVETGRHRLKLTPDQQELILPMRDLRPSLGVNIDKVRIDIKPAEFPVCIESLQIVEPTLTKK